MSAPRRHPGAVDPWYHSVGVLSPGYWPAHRIWWVVDAVDVVGTGRRRGAWWAAGWLRRPPRSRWRA